MDIKQLRTFLAVADSRSFLHAAASLYVTRQAVSKTIKQLEDELQVELFSRSHDGALMTPAGIFFYPRAATLVAEFDQLKKDTMDSHRSYLPKIQICMAQGIYSAFADRLIDYGKAHKNEMDIRTRSCADADCDKVLSDRRADAVLSFTPPISNIARSNVLMYSPLVFLVPKDSSALPVLNDNPDMAKRLPLLLYTGGRDQCLWWSEPPKEEDIVSSDLDHLFYLLKRKKGVLPIPELLVPTYLDFCEVLSVPVKEVSIPIYYSTLYPDHYNTVTYSFLDVIYEDVFEAGIPEGKE